MMSDEKQNGKREEVCPGKKDKLDLVQLRADIEEKNAPEFWRSLEELAGTKDFREAMHLCSLTDELGYTHIRQVEHYFKPYGGYSPNPLIFLTAAALVSPCSSTGSSSTRGSSPTTSCEPLRRTASASKCADEWRST